MAIFIIGDIILSNNPREVSVCPASQKARNAHRKRQRKPRRRNPQIKNNIPEKTERATRSLGLKNVLRASTGNPK
jgi:hypothetical protein